MNPCTRGFHLISMHRGLDDRFSPSTLLMVLAAFSVGVLIAFGCALMYSGSPQPRAATRVTPNVRSRNLEPGDRGGQSSEDESSRPDSQQETPATNTAARNLSSDPVGTAPAQSVSTAPAQLSEETLRSS